ncbi:MAG TPA: hypothetical protein VLH08_17660 [Acidobacteriota bacterium]|nr:hypothetical protein [Acidobacteriota bacterium]
MKIQRLGLLFALCGVLLISTVDAQECVLSTNEKKVVEDAIQKFFLDSLYVAAFSGIHPNGVSSKGELAYSSTLLGTIPFQGSKSDAGVRALVFLNEICSAPKSFPPTCTSQTPETFTGSFWKSHDACAQMFCDAKGLYRIEINWTEVPDKTNGSFSFDASDRQKIVYFKNPKSTWRYNDTINNRLIVSGEQSVDATIVLKDGTRIRGHHIGSFSAISTEEDGLFSFVLNMSFPAYRSLTPLRIELALHRHDADSANGSIQHGDTTLATMILHPGQPLQIDWLNSCN